MSDVINFYLDDSGTRQPDNNPGVAPAHGNDWFALGGVLVNEEDDDEVRRLHSDFCKLWKIEKPLHSHEIRSRRKNFAWVGKLGETDKKTFYDSLSDLMLNAPVIGLACVIDRPGYNKRYKEKYGDNRWQLCKTAFSIAVERAAKYARENDRRVHVFPERCNKADDALLKSYYVDMKTNGMPSEPANMGKYGPLTKDEFQLRLARFEPKGKSSPVMQFADLYLWPICMGGYDRKNRPYHLLKENGKLIEHHIELAAIPQLGTKYSCFDEANDAPE